MGSYLHQIASELIATLSQPGTVVLHFVCELGCRVAPERALYLGLIVIELVTNSLKYAHPTGVNGAIAIRCWRTVDSVVIEVSDDGVGFPEGFDPASSRSGLRIVKLAGPAGRRHGCVRERRPRRHLHDPGADARSSSRPTSPRDDCPPGRAAPIRLRHAQGTRHGLARRGTPHHHQPLDGRRHRPPRCPPQRRRHAQCADLVRIDGTLPQEFSRRGRRCRRRGPPDDAARTLARPRSLPSRTTPSSSCRPRTPGSPTARRPIPTAMTARWSLINTLKLDGIQLLDGGKQVVSLPGGDALPARATAEAARPRAALRHRLVLRRRLDRRRRLQQFRRRRWCAADPPTPSSRSTRRSMPMAGSSSSIISASSSARRPRKSSRASTRATTRRPTSSTTPASPPTAAMPSASATSTSRAPPASTPTRPSSTKRRAQPESSASSPCASTPFPPTTMPRPTTSAPTIPTS